MENEMEPYQPPKSDLSSTSKETSKWKQVLRFLLKIERFWSVVFT